MTTPDAIVISIALVFCCLPAGAVLFVTIAIGLAQRADDEQDVFEDEYHLEEWYRYDEENWSDGE